MIYENEYKNDPQKRETLITGLKSVVYERQVHCP